MQLQNRVEEATALLAQCELLQASAAEEQEALVASDVTLRKMKKRKAQAVV